MYARASNLQRPTYSDPTGVLAENPEGVLKSNNNSIIFNRVSACRFKLVGPTRWVSGLISQPCTTSLFFNRDLA